MADTEREQNTPSECPEGKLDEKIKHQLQDDGINCC